MSEETVTIPKTEYSALIKASVKLNCLEKAGVDNWEWYGDAMEEFNSEMGEDS